MDQPKYEGRNCRSIIIAPSIIIASTDPGATQPATPRSPCMQPSQLLPWDIGCDLSCSLSLSLSLSYALGRLTSACPVRGYRWLDRAHGLMARLICALAWPASGLANLIAGRVRILKS